MVHSLASYSFNSCLYIHVQLIDIMIIFTHPNAKGWNDLEADTDGKGCATKYYNIQFYYTCFSKSVQNFPVKSALFSATCI